MVSTSLFRGLLTSFGVWGVPVHRHHFVNLLHGVLAFRICHHDGQLQALVKSLHHPVGRWVADQDKIGYLGYKSPGHLHLEGALLLL